MQILDIILYNNLKERRIVSFDLGKVNIITGDSKTGKTSIIDIVDFCLGSSFNIAEGTVREHVWWYSVRFQLKNDQILIARPNPIKYERSGSDVYFIQGISLEIPDFDTLKSNINVDTLLLKLASLVGIEEYVHQPENFTRPDTPVTFKHSRFYCFQLQTDIDQRDFLFYNQKKEIWVEQAMKDTLPYFLGAISPGNVIYEKQLAEKKRNRNRLLREQKESNAIIDQAMGQVFELVNEAKQVGLLESDIYIKDREEGLLKLQSIIEQDISQSSVNIESDILLELQNKLQDLLRERSKNNGDIKATKDYQQEANAYKNEVEQQSARLRTIYLLPKNSNLSDHSICPLCEQNISVHIPSIKLIEDSLNQLQQNLSITQREQPRLNEYLKNLIDKRSELNEQIQDISKSINSIYKEQEQAERIKNLNIRKGKVIGRVSLYLESNFQIKGFSDLEKKLFELNNEINALEEKLNNEASEDKLIKILDQLGAQMTIWSKDLDLEFKNGNIKFDIKKLTLYIVLPDRVIQFAHTGSAENWISYHLLIHFALHKFFIVNNRPTPNFFIVDQLSQAYFPPEKDILGTGEISQSEDDKAIRRLFKFIFDRTEELGGQMQTILIDHAKLNDKFFSDRIKEEWRNGLKLVPLKWIED